MATTIVASRTSTLSHSEIRDPPSSALSSLSLSAAPSAMTFFPSLLSPPPSPPLKPQPQSSDEGPTTDSASNLPSSFQPASSTPHNGHTLTLPEPSPPLTPPPQASLSAQIKVATRPIHTRLNRRILGLLPLGLPPHAETPALYVRGMEAIEDIYGALEGTARRVRDGVLEANRRSDKNCRNSGDETSEGTSSDGSPDRRSGQQEDGRRMGAPRVDLVGLDLTGLLGRATRLEHDLLELKRRIAPTDLRVTDSPPSSNHPSPTTNAASADIATQPCPTQEDQTNEARPMSPAVAALTHRFHSLTSSEDEDQHHLLLAPLHQFTLALFNGGRHIRRQLLSAPSSFWSSPACHSSSGALAASLLPAPSPFTLATGSHPPAYFAIPQVHPADDVDGGTADDVLTFWHIPDHEEEEDAKQAFKRTFESVASSLATWEREEVIAEAVSVMQMLESVVEEIVRHVAGLKAQEEPEEH